MIINMHSYIHWLTNLLICNPHIEAWTKIVGHMVPISLDICIKLSECSLSVCLSQHHGGRCWDRLQPRHTRGVPNTSAALQWQAQEHRRQGGRGQRFYLIIQIFWNYAGIILCMHPANKKWRYNVTSFLIGLVHIQNDPWLCAALMWKVMMQSGHNFGHAFPDSQDHGTNMGPTCVLSAPGGPHVGPINLAMGVCSWADVPYGKLIPDLSTLNSHLVKVYVALLEK